MGVRGKGSGKPLGGVKMKPDKEHCIIWDCARNTVYQKSICRHHSESVPYRQPVTKKQSAFVAELLADLGLSEGEALELLAAEGRSGMHNRSVAYVARAWDIGIREVSGFSTWQADRLIVALIKTGRGFYEF